MMGKGRVADFTALYALRDLRCGPSSIGSPSSSLEGASFTTAPGTESRLTLRASATHAQVESAQRGLPDRRLRPVEPYHPIYCAQPLGLSGTGCLISPQGTRPMSLRGEGWTRSTGEWTSSHHSGPQPLLRRG